MDSMPSPSSQETTLSSLSTKAIAESTKEPAPTTSRHGRVQSDPTQPLLELPNPLKRKLDSIDFVASEHSDSDLSDYPDDLSDCTEPALSPVTKRRNTKAQIAADKRIATSLHATRRFTRSTLTKTNQVDAAVPDIESISELGDITTPISSGTNAGAKRLTRASTDTRQPDQTALVNSSHVATTRQSRTRISTQEKKGRISKPKQASRWPKSRIVTFSISSPALELALRSTPKSDSSSERVCSPSEPLTGPSEHPVQDSSAVPQTNTVINHVETYTTTPTHELINHVLIPSFPQALQLGAPCDQTPISSPVRNPFLTSTPQRAPSIQFPPTPNETPRHEAVTNGDLPSLPWSIPSPPKEPDMRPQPDVDLQSSSKPPFCQHLVYETRHSPRDVIQRTQNESHVRETVEEDVILEEPQHVQSGHQHPPPEHEHPLAHAELLQHVPTDVDPNDLQQPTVPRQEIIWPVDNRDQAKLRMYAAKLFPARSLPVTKADSISQPRVWADGRQELCETLHYFRAYHGGSYTTGGFARGFMFDKSAHKRDYMDSAVVIARAGGGLVKDKDTGERVISSDRTEDTKVTSLRNSMQYFNPVVIIAGADNPNMPSKTCHAYSVLDYFKPTHIWTEKSKGMKIMRYRFERLDSTNPSWWTPNDGEQVEHGSLDPPLLHTCIECKHDSQQIYLQGWMCLQPGCPNFWLLAPTAENPLPHEPVEAELEYDPCFLKQRTTWPNDHHEYSLTSNNVGLSGLSIAGEDCSLAYWLGMVCPKCGRCNSRLGWVGWECGSQGCTWTKELPHTFIAAQAIREPYFPLSGGYTMSRDTHLPLVKLDVSFKDNYRINRYTIPGINGFVAHLIANKTVVEEEGGPDQMFEELQQVDIGLRRRGLGNGMLKGESYTRHFTVNYGMPYKFIAATSSATFDGAARPVTHTRSRLNWAAKSLLTDEATRELKNDTDDGGEALEKARQKIEEAWRLKEFNEVLALGYFEQQRINYHDDGEFGLGPTIATLSLGAPGTMRLRMKARHYNGMSNAGVYDDTPPLPGCVAYEARLEAQKHLAHIKATNSSVYRASLKTIPKQLGLKSGGTARDAITLTLAHGDIVIMHGEGIQKYYEHSVDHAGKLRFALTCRYIDPDSLKETDKPDYEVGPDEECYDGSKLPAAA